MSLKIEGVFPPIPTPFDSDGKILHDKLKSNLARWSTMGLHGFVVLGTNGEYVLLNESERASVFETARTAIPKDKLFLAGTGAESTQAAIALTRRAAELGADAAMVVTPHYYKSQMTSANLVNHYRVIADASPIPILIYNMPASTGIDIEVGAVVELAKHPNIVGLKDSSGNVTKFADILRQVNPNFALLAGSGSYLYSSMVLGAKGCVAALANVAPKQTVALYDAIRAGQSEQARSMQLRLLPLNQAVTARWSVPGLKAALDMIEGFFGGAPRLPLRPLGDEPRAELKSIMQVAGVI